MANQATYPSVYDAALVRLAELGRQRRALVADFQPTNEVDQSILDLRLGLESEGLLPNAADRLTVQAYLQNTYGLLGVGLDPLLAPLLPAIPAQGALVRPFVLGIGNGKVLGIGGGKVLGIGVRLVPVTDLTFDTTLEVGATAGAYTYNGWVTSTISFNLVTSTSNQPAGVNLYQNNVQVGHLDYPPEADGQPFAWMLNGSTRYGILDVSSTRYDLLP